jgi:hypothetical protein
MHLQAKISTLMICGLLVSGYITNFSSFEWAKARDARRKTSPVVSAHVDGGAVCKCNPSCAGCVSVESEGVGQSQSFKRGEHICREERGHSMERLPWSPAASSPVQVPASGHPAPAPSSPPSGIPAPPPLRTTPPHGARNPRSGRVWAAAAVPGAASPSLSSSSGPHNRPYASLGLYATTHWRDASPAHSPSSLFPDVEPFSPSGISGGRGKRLRWRDGSPTLDDSDDEYPPLCHCCYRDVLIRPRRHNPLP